MKAKVLEKYSKESILLYASLTMLVLIIFIIIEALGLFLLNNAYQDQIDSNKAYTDQLIKYENTIKNMN